MQTCTDKEARVDMFRNGCTLPPQCKMQSVKFLPHEHFVQISSLCYKSSLTCHCCELQIMLQQLSTMGVNVLHLVEHILCSCTNTRSASELTNLDYNKTYPGGNLSPSKSDCSKRTWITNRKRKSCIILWAHTVLHCDKLSKLAWHWLNDSSDSAVFRYIARKIIQTKEKSGQL